MNTKTYVGKYTEQFQDKLFELGFKWLSGNDAVVNTASFLYINWDNKTLTYEDNLEWFSRKRIPEISVGTLIEKLEKLKAEQKEKEEMLKFKPFDRILVRDSEDQNWIPALFSHYMEGDTYPYLCMAPSPGYRYAIPYKGNEHLANKQD